MTPPRLRVTPLARKIARERGLTLAHIRGSGPSGRIIAADVQPAPEAERRHDGSVQAAAVATRFSLLPIESMLRTFSQAGLSVDFVDVVIRATSATLLALHGSDSGPETSLYLERAGLNLRFDGASTTSLSVISRARLEAPSTDQPGSAIALSIKILDPDGISAIHLPPLPGFEMRLLITVAVHGSCANATLFFNEGRITIEFAALILTWLKQRLEGPVLLLL